jgi:hypothetical protein
MAARPRGAAAGIARAGRSTARPTDHASWEKPDAAAIQALTRGEANADQQQRALRWIVEAAAQTYDRSFVPGSADETAFLEGRRDVGRQIVKLTKIKLGMLGEG